MKLWSNDFQSGQNIPVRFTCDGEDISPHLAWSEVPAEATSLALVCHDPDAPVGDWTHWLVTDIPAAPAEIPTGGPVPAGAREITNHFGYKHYGGPCPPSGTHRYFFILYALKDPTPSGLDKSNFEAKMSDAAVASAELMGTYSRSR
jgi:Raf kinase inhibitor-like YbhB/YbcL family protein